MHTRFSTQGIALNHEFGYWRDAIGSAYFNLQLEFPNTHHFRARLDNWDLGTVSLSRLESTGLIYKRLRQHCQRLDRQILVTIPLHSEVEFTQLGREVHCQPGQYLVEYSDEPYEFRHAKSNLLWVLKVPEVALQARVGNVSRFVAHSFNAHEGVGKLFADYVKLMVSHSSRQGGTTLALMGRQMVDLLAMSLGQHSQGMPASHVKSAHLVRAEEYIRAHLLDADLTPTQVALACGISLRYLHRLFHDSNQGVAEAIRSRRLRHAYEILCSGSAPSVSAVAYSSGFNDHAQFSRLFKAEFGCSPHALMQKARASTS